MRLVFWQLKAGILISAFDSEHHRDIERYVRGIAVNDAEQPSVSYDGRFERGDQRERGQRDQVWFTAAAAPVTESSGLPASAAGAARRPRRKHRRRG